MPRRDFDRAKAELDTIEAELTTRLCAELKKVAAGETVLFFDTHEHNPHNFPEHMLSKRSIEFLRLARESIDLRRLLVMPTDRCVGGFFLAACDESADLTNPHRLGPMRLAARLLSEIEELQRSTS